MCTIPQTFLTGCIEGAVSVWSSSPIPYIIIIMNAHTYIHTYTRRKQNEEKLAQATDGKFIVMKLAYS